MVQSWSSSEWFNNTGWYKCGSLAEQYGIRCYGLVSLVTEEINVWYTYGNSGEPKNPDANSKGGGLEYEF